MTKKADQSIKSVVAKEDDGNIQITFTIPFALIKKAQGETTAELAKDVEVPGFRKGKAPLTKVKEKIPQPTLIEHSLGHILPKALAEAIGEYKLKLAIYPKYELVSAKEGEDWQIRALACELPEIALGDYKNMVQGEIRAASLKKELSKEEKEQTVIRALIENIKFKIPKILIEEEVNSRLANLLSRIEKLGLALESYLASVRKTPETLRTEYETQAKDAIALDLILAKVAQDQNIKVNEAEIESALNVADSSKSASSDQDIESKKRLIESILRRREALKILTS